ncbi:MAG: hydantoinase/carbamoylase family amidase [Solirubrobacteraceae bacterium]
MPDADRISARLQALWEIAHGPGGGADRPAYSAAEAQAMLLVAGWAADQGLEPGIDEHGNLWALPGGAGSDHGPMITSGSHVDTVPDGGRYDGALGTVLGLELVADRAGEAIGGARAGLLVCAAEEAPRFGAGTMGSRLLVGTLSRSELERLSDADGVTAAAAQAEYLRALADLPRIAPPVDRLCAHAEIHIAQRRALRRLGVVRHVASPRRFEIEVTGESGHAGEVSMADRRDALAAAAEIVLAIEASARSEPAETVATVGTMSVSPGAVSVIPGRVRLGVDVRGIDGDSLDRVDATLRADIARIASERSVRTEVRLTRAGRPTELDPQLVDAALAAARRLGIDAEPTWSGAGHDAQHLTVLAPALLVFVPLHGGESHTPQEGADLGECVAASRLVCEVLGRSDLDTTAPV